MFKLMTLPVARRELIVEHGPDSEIDAPRLGHGLQSKFGLLLAIN